MMLMKNLGFYVHQQQYHHLLTHNNDVNKCFIDHPKIAKNQQIAFSLPLTSKHRGHHLIKSEVFGRLKHFHFINNFI
jgi:hypothetical protein